MTTKRRSRLELLFARWNRSLDSYQARRPHRSFKRTYRRDYARSFQLPSYLGLTLQTLGTLGRNRRLFGTFFILYAVASAVVLGVVNQSNYSALVSSLKNISPDVWPRTLAIFANAISGGLTNTATSNAQVFGGLLAVLAWLTMVWLLRHVVNGTKVKLREGLYSSGAPIVPTVLVAIVGLVQCLPLLAVVIGYSAAAGTGLLNGGIEAMLFYAAAGLLTLISLYWLTSTFIALVIVTLPGMYPGAALKAAGDLVVGRRLRLILRLLWLVAVILVIWAIVLIPIILLDNVISLPWLPLVPVCVLALTTVTLMVSSTYIYLLYRKLVDDEAKPA